MFGDLHQQWLRRVHEWDLVPRLLRNVATSSEVPLLCDEEVADHREDLRLFLSSKGLECFFTVPSGQPLALHLLRGMLTLPDDVDAELAVQLERGVGILDTISASGVWRPVEVPERFLVELLSWQEPWSSGRQDPDTVLQLVQEDVDLGFAEWLPGGLAEARVRFGAACPAGRLGLVKQDGSAPRLVGDSAVSGKLPLLDW
ncbi:Ubr3 [Symbiodinium necroappetens]|uniref:Ubr3 protein n=1 Tax=Symbiodinium necroappetens TaxID=1628268 RepID=A0A813BNB4_9DINO|nr:Ubr3 [Symbiodinium necroappetens]